MNKTKRIALLIDCDNASHKKICLVLRYLNERGTVVIRHAHGDWKSQSLNGWVSRLADNRIKPIQQFAPTKKKNATDISVVIDAMDLLYQDKVDTFALMTSDSDFTSLAVRLIEDSRSVYGFGYKQTPRAFVSACTEFKFIDRGTNTL